MPVINPYRDSGSSHQSPFSKTTSLPLCYDRSGNVGNGGRKKLFRLIVVAAMVIIVFLVTDEAGSFNEIVGGDILHREKLKDQLEDHMVNDVAEKNPQHEDQAIEEPPPATTRSTRQPENLSQKEEPKFPKLLATTDIPEPDSTLAPTETPKLTEEPTEEPEKMETGSDGGGASPTDSLQELKEQLNDGKKNSGSLFNIDPEKLKELRDASADNDNDNNKPDDGPQSDNVSDKETNTDKDQKSADDKGGTGDGTEGKVSSTLSPLHTTVLKRISHHYVSSSFISEGGSAPTAWMDTTIAPNGKNVNFFSLPSAKKKTELPMTKTVKAHNDIQYVTFPSPMKTNALEFNVVDLEAIFVVNLLDIDLDEKGEHTFFTHGDAYFSVKNGKLAFHSEEGEKFVLASPSAVIDNNQFIVAGYKISGSTGTVAISLNGGQFSEFKSKDSSLFLVGEGGKPNSFVGGDESGAFQGGLAEIMFITGVEEGDDKQINDEIMEHLKVQYAEVNEFLAAEGEVKEHSDVGDDEDEEEEEVKGKNTIEPPRVNRESELTEIEREELKKLKAEQDKEAIEMKAKESSLAEADKSPLTILEEKHEEAMKAAQAETLSQVKELQDKHKSEVIEVESTQVEVKAGGCKGGDAFEGVNIDAYEPPSTADFADVQKWEEAMKKSKKSISEQRFGGEQLREYVHKEVLELKLLRHQLFCDKTI